MLLEILIPQYKETDDIIKPLLDSIKEQINIDFNEIGVIITNDGSDVFLSEKLLSSYPFKVQYFKNEHKGISATRNFCLDKATADYIMFCDADDLFINSLGLQLIINEIKRQKIDFINSTFMEEIKTTSGNIYIPHDQDMIFVHGKIYNREFLIKENIRWDESLLIHEDSYFNILAISSAKTKIKCDTPFYLWRWNDKSTSRSDKYYIIKTYDYLIKSASRLSEELEKRQKISEAAEMFCLNMFQTFYILTGSFMEVAELKDKIETSEMLALEFYQKFSSLFTKLPGNQILQIRQKARDAAIRNGWYKERFVFNDWVEYLTKKYTTNDIKEEIIN